MRSVEPAPLQIAPVVRTPAGAIGEADQFPSGVAPITDQHEDALFSSSRRASRLDRSIDF
ncbi:hypothetical protein ABIB80_004524 [Bradyrhizobium sp. i1.15.2]